MPLLVFDGDCGFCSTCVRVLLRWFPGAFDAAPYQELDLASIGLDVAAAAAAVQWVPGSDVAPLAGAPAVAALLRHAGKVRGGSVGACARLFGVTLTHRPFSVVADAGYRVIAANRHRLPGGTPACAPRHV